MNKDTIFNYFHWFKFYFFSRRRTRSLCAAWKWGCVCRRLTVVTRRVTSNIMHMRTSFTNIKCTVHINNIIKSNSTANLKHNTVAIIWYLNLQLPKP